MIDSSQSFTVFFLVLVRTAGTIGFNPLFSRRNVPAMVRAGLIMLITVLIAPSVAQNLPGTLPGATFPLMFAMLRELFVGLSLAMVFLIFYYMIFAVGDLMDTQFGLSMAKVFDPGTSIQASFSGNLLGILFILLFFHTDCHLVLLRIYAASYQLVPLGTAVMAREVSGFFLTLFSSVFSMALRLVLPFIAAELVVEASMGVLMKLIPQIHVFVINIQLKITMGIVMLLIFTQPIADFLDGYLDAMMKSMQQVLLALGG